MHQVMRIFKKIEQKKVKSEKVITNVDIQSDSYDMIRRELFCDGQINCGGHEKDEQIE